MQLSPLCGTNDGLLNSSHVLVILTKGVLSNAGSLAALVNAVDMRDYKDMVYVYKEAGDEAWDDQLPILEE